MVGLPLLRLLTWHSRYIHGLDRYWGFTCYSVYIIPLLPATFLNLLLLDLVKFEMVSMPHQIIPCLTSECIETAVIRKFINLVCSFIRWSSTLYLWPMKGDSLGHSRHFENLLLVFILTASDILKKNNAGLKNISFFCQFFFLQVYFNRNCTPSIVNIKVPIDDLLFIYLKLRNSSLDLWTFSS